MPDLLVDASRNSHITNQPPDTPSPPDASARWTAVVADQKAAGNGAQPSQKPTTTNGTQPSQTVTLGQTGNQKPAAGSNWSMWIHGGLTAGSFCPSLIGAGVSAVDGVVYAVEGDRKNAALSFGAAGAGILTDAGVVKVAALGLGAASKALKVGETAIKAEKEASSIAKVGETVVKVEKDANTAAKVGEAAKPVGAAVERGATSIRKAGGLPHWLKTRFEAGAEFNRVNRARYPANELEVTDKAGNKFRVDSYNPGKGEIVSRKFTQLSEVKPETGVGYLRELPRKYPSGATISESGFNPKTLRGQRLTGDLVLEVPVQKSPIPKAVLEYANNNGIIIRDVSGVVH